MGKRICNKGFLVSPSETDGQNVPFFVITRSKDIVWDEEYIDERNLIQYSKLGTERELQYPTIRWTFQKDGWDIDLYSNGQIQMKKKVKINEEMLIKSQYEIVTTVELPIRIINDNRINIQVTNNAVNNSTKSSINNVVIDSKRSYVDKVDIGFINTFFTFSENTRDYDNDYAFVSVNAYVQK